MLRPVGAARILGAQRLAIVDANCRLCDSAEGGGRRQKWSDSNSNSGNEWKFDFRANMTLPLTAAIALGTLTGLKSAYCESKHNGEEVKCETHTV